MRIFAGWQSVKQKVKKLISVTSVIIIGTSSLATAAPMLFSQTALAASSIVYMSPTGSGTTCSSADPCSSFDDAMNAVATGGEIYMRSGTYTQQLNINKSVNVVGAGTSYVTVQAPSTMGSDGNIVTISGSGVSAELYHLTISGPGNSSCGSISSGVYVTGGASANIKYIDVNSIRDSSLSGCQNGRAINIDNGTATINHTSISDYQKEGVYVTGASSYADITNNTITGVGETTEIAQNGIVVISGAKADISGNTITGNECDAASCGSDPVNDYQSIGILLYGAADGTTVTSNKVKYNDIGIYNQELGTSTISSNTLTSNRYEGMVFDQGNSTADSNTVNGGNIGIYVVSYTGNSADSSVTLTGDSVKNATTPFEQYDQDSTDGYTTNVSAPTNVYVKHSWTSSSSTGHVYGFDAFSTVSDGIDAVASGGTVNVASGTYTENVSISKSLTLDGAQTGIDGNSHSGSESILSASSGNNITVNSGTVTVDGFEFKNTGTGAGISILGGSGDTIQNNVFNGISSGYAANGDFVSATISHNLVENSNIGFEANTVAADNASIANNTFTGDSNYDIGFIQGGSGVSVSSNNASNESSNFLALFKTNGATVSGNTATGLSSSVVFVGGGNSNLTIGGSNSFTGNTSKAINISNIISSTNSGITVSGNDLSDNTYGVYVGSGSVSDNVTVSDKNDLSGNSTYGVYNDASSGGSVDATSNWWGNVLGPIASQYNSGGGTVTYSPWCTDSSCSATQSATSGNTSLPSGPVGTPTVSGSTSSVTIPDTNNVTASVSTTSGTVSITIPSGATITADSASWDGTINPPTVVDSSTVSLPSGYTASQVISIGSSSVSLTFDKAVELVFSGQAGKSVGYVPVGGSFTPISACTSLQLPDLDVGLAGGACYVTSGSDLIVWTEHFTSYVTYSATPSNNSGSSSSSSGGSTAVASSATLASATTFFSSTATPGAASTVLGANTQSPSAAVSSTSTNVPSTVAKTATNSGKFLGLKWYWWIPIALVIAAIIYYVYRKAGTVDQTNSSSK